MNLRINSTVVFRWQKILSLIVGGCVLCVRAYAVAPVAVDDTRTIVVNSSATINVLANDFDADGDSLSVVDVSASENGVVQLNSDGSIYYTPNQGFVGVDTFTYTLQEINTEVSLTSVGRVSIVVEDNSFNGIAGSTNTQNVARAFSNYCNNLQSQPAESVSQTQLNMIARCKALSLMADVDAGAAAAALRQIAPEETLSQMRQSMNSSRTQTSVVSQRIATIKASGPAFTVNGLDFIKTAKSRGGAAGDVDSVWAPFGVFATIQTEKTERDQTLLENGYQTSGQSFTLGMDYRAGAHSVYGVAYGKNRVELTYGNNAGEFDSNIDTGVVFAAWELGEWSLESQLSHSNLQFDSQRNIRYADPTASINISALGKTRGTQQNVNLKAQWQWHKNALTLFPNIKIEALQNSIEGYEEYGVVGYSIGLGEQNSSQVTVSAGVQATYVLNYQWGVFIPTVEITTLSEVDSTRNDVSGYFIFDTDSTNTFTLKNDGGDSSFYQASAGASLVLKHGLSAFFLYQQVSGYQFFTASQIQAGFRYEL